MKKKMAAVLILGTVVGGSATLAQTVLVPVPNSGAGVSGMPGNKSGPSANSPTNPGQQSTGVLPDQSKVPGLPGSKSGPALQPPTGLQNQAQDNEEEDEDYEGFFRHHPGMMGMMRHRWGHQEGRGMMHPMVMRLIFGMIDADGDGKLTLQEWQSAQERIFKEMDTDHDGTVSFEELQAFMHGR